MGETQVSYGFQNPVCILAVSHRGGICILKKKMSHSTIPPPLSADGLRIQRLERELADLKSSYDKALDDVYAHKAEIQRKDADMQRLTSEKHGAATESKAIPGNTNPSAGSGSKKASAEIEQLRNKAVETEEANRKLRERIETLEKRNETLEKLTETLEEVEEQGRSICSDAVRYESLVNARLKRFESGQRTAQQNVHPSKDELSALKSLKDRSTSKAAHAGPPLTKPALQVSARGGRGSRRSKKTATPNVVPEQGFVTPSKSKTAPVNRGQQKPSVEAYDVLKNCYGLLDDTQSPVPEKSQCHNPQTSEQSIPQASGEDTRSSGDGTATNTGVGGTPEAMNQKKVLKAGEAKEPQVISASATPLSAPAVVERQTIAPHSGPPRMPQPSQEMGATKKGKQPESRYDSSGATTPEGSQFEYGDNSSLGAPTSQLDVSNTPSRGESTWDVDPTYDPEDEIYLSDDDSDDEQPMVPSEIFTCTSEMTGALDDIWTGAAGSRTDSSSWNFVAELKEGMATEDDMMADELEAANQEQAELDARNKAAAAETRPAISQIESTNKPIDACERTPPKPSAPHIDIKSMITYGPIPCAIRVHTEPSVIGSPFPHLKTPGMSINLRLDPGKLAVPSLALDFRISKIGQDSLHEDDYHTFSVVWEPGVEIEGQFMIEELSFQRIDEATMRIVTYPLEIREAIQRPEQKEMLVCAIFRSNAHKRDPFNRLWLMQLQPRQVLEKVFFNLTRMMEGTGSYVMTIWFLVPLFSDFSYIYEGCLSHLEYAVQQQLPHNLVPRDEKKEPLMNYKIPSIQIGRVVPNSLDAGPHHSIISALEKEQEQVRRAQEGIKRPRARPRNSAKASKFPAELEMLRLKDRRTLHRLAPP